MPLQPVALIPQCAECRTLWLPDDRERWRAYFDTDDEIVFFCAQCSERELRDSADSKA
jgi:RNase P subunit RPR2